MLGFDDSESVMNAAGTMGTLVSNISKFGHFVMTLLFHLKISTIMKIQNIIMVQFYINFLIIIISAIE